MQFFLNGATRIVFFFFHCFAAFFNRKIAFLLFFSSKTAFPATKTFAPASTASLAVRALMPPSTSMLTPGIFLLLGLFLAEFSLWPAGLFGFCLWCHLRYQGLFPSWLAGLSFPHVPLREPSLIWISIGSQAETMVLCF